MQPRFFFFPDPDTSGNADGSGANTDTATADPNDTGSANSTNGSNGSTSDPNSSADPSNPSSTGDPNASGSSATPVSIHYDVSLVAQPDETTCWAASSSMVLSYWRDKNAGSSSPSYTIQEIKDMVTNGNSSIDVSGGLKPEDTVTVGGILGLAFDSPMCYLVKGFADTLTAKGPMVFIRASMGGKGAHAIAVIGMNGDGTPDGTNIETLNPWPVGSGAAETVTFTNLMSKMEQLGFWDNSDWAKDGGADRVYVMYKA